MVINKILLIALRIMKTVLKTTTKVQNVLCGRVVMVSDVFPQVGLLI